MTEETQKSAPGNLSEAFSEFMEHQRRACEETGKAIDALLPEGFKQHGSTTREEFRKGIKVLVDYTIDELEKLTKEDEKKAETGDDSDGPPPSTTGRTKVKVQVE